MLHIVLFQPVIPPNTGNIARSCVGMGAALHLIGPLGFDLSDKAVRRAGLDYWEHLDLTVHEDKDAFLDWLGDREPWLVTKHGALRFDEPGYGDGDVILFGAEQNGLPTAWHEKWAHRRVIIPMSENIRSYNLSNAAAIVLASATAKAGLFGP